MDLGVDFEVVFFPAQEEDFDFGVGGWWDGGRCCGGGIAEEGLEGGLVESGWLCRRRECGGGS